MGAARARTGEELHWATLVEAVAGVIGGHDAVVQGSRRCTWAELEDRSARLAQALLDAGLAPGSKVAQYLFNSIEYAESYVAALKIRAVPVNVNYRYLEEELAYLLENCDAEALVYHRSLGGRVAAVVGRLPRLRLIVEVDDGTGPSAPGASRLQDILSASSPAAPVRRSPADRIMTYTGGTTGLPKGVMVRVGHSLGRLLE